MKHLQSFSVYQKLDDISNDIDSLLKDMRCDGLELLTSYEPVPEEYRRYTVSVHLPYSTDWLAAWQGRPYDMDPLSSLYYMYGRDRTEIISNVRRSIEYAAELHPAHGVIHASNADISELIHRNYTRDSFEVLSAFCDMINQTVSGFPDGEPPFRLLFENLWWPGLRLKDEKDYRFLEERIEFDNWGICLDTGHLMNSLPVTNQSQGIDMLLDIFSGYPQDLIDRIHAVHFHYSDSAEYRSSFTEMDADPARIMDYITAAYSHIGRLDRHLPFTDPKCRELIGILKPDIVVHELPYRGGTPGDDFRGQRSLLD